MHATLIWAIYVCFTSVKIFFAFGFSVVSEKYVPNIYARKYNSQECNHTPQGR